jgi:aminoglycoside phosphotransferase (APT) family kinase protein
MQWQMPPGGTSGGTSTLVGSDLKALGIPSMDEYVAMYCRNAGLKTVPNMDYYAAYNFFRLAGILQGIVGRVRDGTATNAFAAAKAALVRPLAAKAWEFALQA